MTDERTVYYATTKDVSGIYKPGVYQPPVVLSADSGSGQANKNRVNVSIANLQIFTAGDYVRVYDTANPIGEVVQVQSVVPTGPYLEVTADMTKNFTTAQNGKAELQSAFTSESTNSIEGALPKQVRTKPNAQEVCALINQTEAYIENQCKRAWRVKCVTEETHDFPLRIFSSRDWLDGIPIKLNYRWLRAVKSADGSYKLDINAVPADKVEIYGGGTWQDWASLYTGGRSNTWWVDPMRGMLYLRSFYKIYSRLAVRVTYRYGETAVPTDIKRATALLVAAQLSESEDRVVSQPSGEGINIVEVSEKAARWRKEAELILTRYREQVSIW
jgi:hypothetical protein